MTETEDRQKWLAGLKVGDEVIIEYSSSNGVEYYFIEKIKEIDYEEIITISDDKWVFKNGEVSNRESFFICSIKLVPPSKETNEYFELKRLKEWIKTVKTYELSLDQLRRIKAIIEDKMFNENTYNPACPDYDGELGCCKSGKACRKEGCEKETRV